MMNKYKKAQQDWLESISHPNAMIPWDAYAKGYEDAEIKSGKEIDRLRKLLLSARCQHKEHKDGRVKQCAKQAECFGTLNEGTYTK